MSLFDAPFNGVRDNIDDDNNFNYSNSQQYPENIPLRRRENDSFASPTYNNNNNNRHQPQHFYHNNNNNSGGTITYTKVNIDT